MTQYLPPNLLALFAPRDPIPYLPPLDKLPHEKKLTPYTGVANFLLEFEDPKDTPPPTRVETKDERKERKRKERAEQVAYKLEQDLALWDPTNDPQATGDPFKSLFVGRINYDTSDSKLRREFEVYGPVKRINMVVNKTSSKPRGYAFVEYEHERDMHSAYKHADGKKIDGRRVLVDVERSRTVKGWRPRRLGGGLGGTRKGGPEVNTKYSGRDDSSGMHRDREDRSRSRERPSRKERSRSRDRGRKANRSRSRERKRRSRSRERGEGGREGRRERDRDRERERDRYEEEGAVEEERPSRRRRRSRSREKKRSRSRERKRTRRSRSRERGGGRRDRSRDRRNQDEAENQYAEMDYTNVQIKEEPNGDAYDMYAGYSSSVSAAPQEEVPQFQNYATKPLPEDEQEEQAPPPPTQTDIINFTPFPAATNEYGSYKEESNN